LFRERPATVPGSARASRAGDGALAIANFDRSKMEKSSLRRGAATRTRGACAPQMKSAARNIPAVARVLESIEPGRVPPALVTQLVRQYLASLRASGNVPSFREIVREVKEEVANLARTRLQSVINGTGILIHTNLGRVPLAAEALRALDDAGRNYDNLEFDLHSGVRGGRGDYLERALAELCQAQSVCVVNNCAAALVLTARHFTRRKPEIVISRGELVQIGGGFRIAEILEAAGAVLREVGSTNKTTASDYARAISSATAMILKVHRSNFFMSGFVASPSTAELAALARKKRIPFLEDLGSGSIAATERFGAIEHEPTVPETLRAGADLVCFSGDKLFGGPQAGIIAGKQRFVSALKRDPLFRALRCDKLVFSALQATTELHLAKNFDAIPILHFLKTPAIELKRRAENIIARLDKSALEARIEQTRSQIGGGALPRSQIESIGVVIRSDAFSANEIAERLRHGSPPVIGYVAKKCFLLDLRTILPAQDEQLVQTIGERLVGRGRRSRRS
jgi:L-seryl-tRNA(Ser) seleniumtransferase